MLLASISRAMETTMTETKLESVALWVLLMLLMMVPLIFE